MIAQSEMPQSVVSYQDFQDCIDFDGQNQVLLIAEPSDLTDDYRDPTPNAYSQGGWALSDQRVINKYRNALRMLISQIGRQLISGKFKLENTSFPISC